MPIVSPLPLPLTNLTLTTALPSMIRTLLPKAPVLPLLADLPVLICRRAQTLYWPYGNLGFVWIGVDVGDDWVYCAAGAGRIGGAVAGLIRGRCGVGDVGEMGRRAADVAVAFKDFFRCDIRGVVEEGRVIEY